MTGTVVQFKEAQPAQNPVSIFIAIPSGRGGWASEFCMGLIDLIMRPLGEYLGYEPQMNWAYARSSNLSQNRHKLVRQAMSVKATHILWLDDDMTFPRDTLLRLLKADKDIVGCNCTTRALPIMPTAIKDGKRLKSIGRSGLEEVIQVGLAVVLMKTAVFEKMPLPWFLFMWDPEYADTYMSEDMYMCRKARSAGYKIYIDHDLSNEIGHLGEMEFVHSMTEVEIPT